MNGAADATTFVINLPSPIKNPAEFISCANIEPLTDTEPVNSEPI